MARCCGNSGCSCKVEPGVGIGVAGSGTGSDPFVISLEGGLITVTDTSTVDLSLTGNGDPGTPYNLQAVATVSLDALTDVNTAGGVTGYVLTRQVDGSYALAPPSTAPAGTVHHDATLTGDGSSGTPLGVVATSEFQITASGIELSDATRHNLVRQFADVTALNAAANPTAALNDLASTDSVPGLVRYFDGTNWHPITPFKSLGFVSELLAISGPFALETPITVLTRSETYTVDASGLITLLDGTDLAGFSGVLSCHFQPVLGAVPYAVNVDTNGSNEVIAKCFKLTDGTALVSTTVDGLVTAYVY